MPRFHVRVAVVVTLLSGVRALAAPIIPITACEQTVDHAVGQLTADLDCSANPLAVGVTVVNGKLLLNGHSITGAEIGVGCSDRCAIYGPGSITGNTTGIDVYATKPNRGKLVVSGVTLTGNAALGVGGDRIKVTGSTISGNGGLVVSGRTVGGGILASRSVSVRTSTIDGNYTHGICSPEKISIGGTSSVQGNGVSPTCDPDPYCGACGDLVSTAKPNASKNSTCGTSVNPPSDTWGVCGGD